MRNNLIAVSMAALMTSISAQSSPLDQVIAVKQSKQKKNQVKMPKIYKMGGKAPGPDAQNDSSPKKRRKVESDAPSKKEQEILATIAKYPEIVAQILQEGVQNKQAEQRIDWAKNVKNNLPAIQESGIHFGGAHDFDVSVLMFVDFLCPHCQTHLKMIRDIRKKNANVKFIVYSVPLFQGDLTREYGVILNAAYQKDATKFLSLLGIYSDVKPSKDALLAKVNEFKIDLQELDYSDLSSYDKHASIMEKIGLTQVPVSFALIKDKTIGTIVVPINIMGADSLVSTVEVMKNTSLEERNQIQKSLGQ